MEGKKNMNIIDRLNFYQGLGIIYAVGLAGHLIEALRPLMFFLTPAVLIISGIIILLEPLREKKWHIITWLAAAGIITFFLEVAGVATGKIFGFYTYGTVLGSPLLGVPPVIGFNWVIVTYSGIHAARHITEQKNLYVPLAALFVLLFDIILEPVAVAFGYWQWSDGTIPMQNYTAWFIIALAFAFSYAMLIKEKKAPLPSYYFLLLTVYFLVLNITVT